MLLLRPLVAVAIRFDVQARVSHSCFVIVVIVVIVAIVVIVDRRAWNRQFQRLSQHRRVCCEMC